MPEFSEDFRIGQMGFQVNLDALKAKQAEAQQADDRLKTACENAKAPTVIKPTVGRVVLYHPFGSDRSEMAVNGDQPLAAIVSCVWSDTCINLAVFDANGTTHNRTSVTLVQDGDPIPAYGYAEWMPYQKGQAAKAEALEAKLSAAGK